MTSHRQNFFHHFRAMDTRVLLLRYRSGGLLPEARAALLEVLEDRGYTVETLESKGADEVVTQPMDDSAETAPVPTKAGRLLSTGWRWVTRKLSAFALRAMERVCLRETWTWVVRIGLLVVCMLSAQQASLFGMGFFIVANVFCDAGPQVKCFHMGLRFFEVGATADLLVIPIILALMFPKKWLVGYLKIVPVLSLMVFVAAIHWYGVLPPVCSRVAELSALIAVLTTAYLVLSRKSAPDPAPESV